MVEIKKPEGKVRQCWKKVKRAKKCWEEVKNAKRNKKRKQWKKVNM